MSSVLYVKYKKPALPKKDRLNCAPCAQTTPCAIIASATFMKPAMFAPMT